MSAQRVAQHACPVLERAGCGARALFVLMLLLVILGGPSVTEPPAPQRDTPVFVTEQEANAAQG